MKNLVEFDSVVGRLGQVLRLGVPDRLRVRIQALDLDADLVGLVIEAPHGHDALHLQVPGTQEEIGLDRKLEDRECFHFRFRVRFVLLPVCCVELLGLDVVGFKLKKVKACLLQQHLYENTFLKFFLLNIPCVSFVHVTDLLEIHMLYSKLVRLGNVHLYPLLNNESYPWQVRCVFPNFLPIRRPHIFSINL